MDMLNKTFILKENLFGELEKGDLVTVTYQDGDVLCVKSIYGNRTYWALESQLEELK